MLLFRKTALKKEVPLWCPDTVQYHSNTIHRYRAWSTGILMNRLVILKLFHCNFKHILHLFESYVLVFYFRTRQSTWSGIHALLSSTSLYLSSLLVFLLFFSQCVPSLLLLLLLSHSIIFSFFRITHETQAPPPFCTPPPPPSQGMSIFFSSRTEKPNNFTCRGHWELTQANTPLPPGPPFFNNISSSEYGHGQIKMAKERSPLGLPSKFRFEKICGIGSEWFSLFRGKKCSFRGFPWVSEWPIPRFGTEWNGRNSAKKWGLAEQKYLRSW
jgi:hypothetical protein